MPHPPLRTGIVGIGGYGRTHLNALGSLATRQAGVSVTSVVCIAPDREAAALAEARSLGARVYPDLPALLDAERGRTDLLCLPTPIHLHEPMATAAMEAGFDVLIEKPLCAGIGAADRLITVRDRLSRFATVGFQEAHQDAVPQARAALGAAHRGARISVFGLWPRGHDYYRRNNWAGRLRVDGLAVLDSPANNALAHFIHLALVLAGDASRTARPVSVAGTLWRAQEIESFDTCTVTIATDTGASIHVALSHSVDESDEPFVEASTDDGSVRYRVHDGWSWRSARDETAVWPTPGDIGRRSVMFERAAAARHGLAPNRCTLESARAHVEVIDRLHHSLPILQVPESRIARSTDRTWIPGLPALLRRCSADRSVLSPSDFATG